MTPSVTKWFGNFVGPKASNALTVTPTKSPKMDTTTFNHIGNDTVAECVTDPSTI
jgi:hypothetical protein